MPSRIETGEVEIIHSEPQETINNYVQREGIRVQSIPDVPCYIPALDMVQLNPYTKGETTWYSTAFHGFAHSTGAKKRLKRIGITGSSRGLSETEEKSRYAVEECIAEITASLCCGGYMNLKQARQDNMKIVLLMYRVGRNV